MSKGRKRRAEKHRRREARESLRAAKLEDAPSLLDRTPRRIFVGKARSGDAAEIRFQFSGAPVPYDEADPSDGLRERTADVRLLAMKTTNNFTDDNKLPSSVASNCAAFFLKRCQV